MKKSFLHQLIITLIAFCFSVSAFAQVVSVKGVGSAKYSFVLSAADKDQAYQAAQVAAVERYFAENGEAESENFEAVQDKVTANLDKFILSTTILNEEDKAKRYSVTVKVELNVAKLRNTLKSSSNVAKASNSQKLQMVYLFIAREVASVKSFDDRVVKRKEVNAEQNSGVSASSKTKENESVKANSYASNASVEESEKIKINRSVTVETGGSKTRRSDDVAYRLLPMGNHKTSITSTFSQSGFLVADPEFVLDDSEMKSVNADYTSGNDLAPSTIRSVVASLKKAQIPYLVLATLDLNAPEEDPATGLRRASVSVTGRVMDISGNIPREVASVPPVQFFGMGSDNASASTKALKEASLAAAKEVVSRLNAAGIQ